MFVIGIVGSPGGGKSTVARRLTERGAIWINADLIARSVLEESDIQQQLKDYFGVSIANREGQIDRSKIAARVFGDDETKRTALKYLESLVHPRTRLLIRDHLQKAARRDADVVILDVPLLFESAWDRSCDEIWCIDASRNLRIERVKQRGWGAHELLRREANQLDISEKKRLSSFVVMNDGTLGDLHEIVDQRWAAISQQPSSDRHCNE